MGGVGRKLILKDLIRSSCYEKNPKVDQHERKIGDSKNLLRLDLIAPNWASPQPISGVVQEPYLQAEEFDESHL